jgi:hypothetical protein
MSGTTSETDDPEIIIDLDVEEGAESAAEAPEQAQEDTVAPAIETLKAQLADAKAARLAAERREREAAEAAAQARTGAHDANLNMVNGAIERVKQDTATLKLALKEAWTIGDYDKAADIQEAMATNAANMMRLTDGKAAMEAAPPQKAVPAAADPVEALASQLSAASAAWVRKHPECVTDQRMFQKMVAAHNLAVADGIGADTPEYFNFVETTLKLKPVRASETPRTPDPAPQEEKSPMSEAAAPAQRRSAPPAAPVSRQNVPGQKPNVMRLTQAEANIAADMGMTVKEYAANKAKLVAEGRL